MPNQLPVLSRPRQGAVILGVCAGVSRRLGVEPKVIRILAVVAAVLFGGLGVALYAAGFLLVPRDGEQLSPLAKALPFTRNWPRGGVIAAVIVGCVALTWGTGSGPALVPVILVGLLLWWALGRSKPRAAAPAEPTPFERAADAWRVRLAEQQVPGFALPAAQPQWQQPYTDPADQLVADTPVPLPAIPARRSWRLWSLALALSGIGITAVMAIGLITGNPPAALAYTAVVLASLGVTALVAARFGRPPLLIPATLVTAVALAGQLAFGGLPSVGTIGGDVTRSYSDPAQLPSEINVSAGDLNLDLSQLKLTADRTLTVEVNAGDAHVTLPLHAGAEVDYAVNFGDFSVIGLGDQHYSGSGTFSEGPSDATSTLHLVLRVNAGDAQVSMP